MAKISVSLPDELKARLDAHAKATGQGVSDIVQEALEKLLSGGSDPNPPDVHPTPDPKTDLKIEAIRRYLNGLAIHHEQLRRSIETISNLSMMSGGLPVPYPPPLQPPNWTQF